MPTLKKVLGRIAFGLMLSLFLIACGEEPTPTPTPSAEILLGQQVFTDHCSICHSTSPGVVLRGPSLATIGIQAKHRVPDQDTRTYLYNSIMRPGDYIVDGFDNIMPTTLAKDLSGEELDAVVAYLTTLTRPER